MKPTVEQIRQLATSAARYIKQSRALDEPLDEMIDDLENMLAAVWPQVFPETAPPEGSVFVRVAVSYGTGDDDGDLLYAKGIDSETEESVALNEVQKDDDTHRGIIEAWLPPVALTPIVQGTSIAAEVEVRE